MILGIDLGTSMVKAVGFSMDGICLATASRRSVLNHLGAGRIEQDFEAIVASVGDVVATYLETLAAVRPLWHSKNRAG